MLIHRYVLKEHIWPFFLGVFSLTVILIMNQIFVLVWDIVGKGIKATTVLYVLFLYLPSIITLTVPMGVMVSSCMAFGRLSQDMEIMALRATGVNPLKLNTLPVIFGVGLTFLMVWFNNHILPESNHRLKNIMLDMAQKKPCFRIRALVTLEDFPGYDMQVGEVDYKKSEIYKVKLFEKETGREIFAKRGFFYTDSAKITLLLKDGEIHELYGGERYRRLSFLEHYIYLPVDNQFVQQNREYRGERELSACALQEKIQELKNTTKGPSDVYKKRKISSLLVEYHKKYSIPFACLAFVILGCPLAIRVRRGGAGAGFGLALLIFIFYYVCLVGGENLGDRGVIAPWLSMWFPNLVLLLLGGWTTYRANK